MNTREIATYIVGHNGCSNIDCSGFGGLNNGKVCPFKRGEYDCEKLGIFETAKKWLADHPINEEEQVRYQEITLRDYLAGQFLIHLLSRKGSSIREISEFAYKQADVMLKAREDTKND